jgi:hypothetical protein
MSELQGPVESYLQSADYRLLEQRSGFVIADRLGLGGERDTWLVWVPKTPPLLEDYWRLESSLLGQFSTHLPQYPRAKCFVVLPTFEGFSQDFRSECRRLNVTLTVPIRFFDAPYKVDLSSKYTSAISTQLR